MKKQAIYVLAVLAALELAFWIFTFVQKHKVTNDPTTDAAAPISKGDAANRS